MTNQERQERLAASMERIQKLQAELKAISQKPRRKESPKTLWHTTDSRVLNMGRNYIDIRTGKCLNGVLYYEDAK